MSTGCATQAQNGALIGGAGGAALGAGIGSLSHARAGEGALIGAAIGTIGGYIIGNEMDKSDQRQRQQALYQPTRAAAPAQPAARPVTRADVINWTRAGERDEVIIDRVQRSGTVFRMTAAEENDLRDADVSEDVIRAMKNTGR